MKFSPCSRNLVSFAHCPSKTRSSKKDVSIVKFWNVLDGSCVATIEPPDVEIHRMAFIADRDNYQVLLLGTRLFAMVWCPARSTSEIALDYSSAKDQKQTEFLDVSEGSQYILSLKSFDTIEIWNMQGHVRILQSFHHPGCRVVAFSKDQRRVVSASYDTVKVWNIHNAVCETTRSTPPGGIERIESVAF